MCPAPLFCEWHAWRRHRLFRRGKPNCPDELPGRTIFVEPADWSIEEGGHVVAGVKQIPLRLAWAITIHKSQGMSLDAAHMDLRDAFEHGQGYVAISRVRTLAGLSLAGFNERALEVHPEIAAKDEYFREASRTAQEHFKKIPQAELEKDHNDFILACGGTLGVVEVERKEKVVPQLDL